MELIASGRASAVYAIDDRTVLRRSGFDTTGEARLMRYLRERGYPVPEVFRSDGGEMLIERLHGPTLLDALVAGSVDFEAAAETMLGLLADLHRIEPPRWLATTSRGIDMTAGGAERAVLHLDLHPANVLVTEEGPKVIDWSNAAIGSPAIDRAVAWAILAEADSAALEPRLASGVDLLLDLVGAGLPSPILATAVRFREADTSLSEAELGRARKRLEALRRR